MISLTLALRFPTATILSISQPRFIRDFDILPRALAVGVCQKMIQASVDKFLCFFAFHGFRRL